MDSSYKKIRLIFLLIIALPTAIFSIYEIGSYKENEKVINTIYDNQLDAILYSVNQYSNDVISGWASDIDIICDTDTIEAKKELSKLKNEKPTIQTLFQFTTNMEPILSIEPDSSEIKLQVEITNLLKDSIQIINKLEKYIKGNYRKIESFSMNNNNYQLLVFLIKAKERTIVNALVLKSLEFIEDVLDPKIQEISRDKFYIGAFIDTSTNVIYNSDKRAENVEFTHSKPFWFFSNYYLGIELKDQSINQLVRSKSRQDIFIIAIIDLVLLFGAWLIYRNLKKQMELAQLKSDFISNVSHEIRTPLALISMYIETLDLNRVRTEEKKKEYYSIIYNETQRLSNLVNKILNFSQIENDKRKYVFTKTNVNNIRLNHTSVWQPLLRILRTHIWTYI